MRESRNSPADPQVSPEGEASSMPGAFELSILVAMLEARRDRATPPATPDAAAITERLSQLRDLDPALVAKVAGGVAKSETAAAEIWNSLCDRWMMGASANHAPQRTEALVEALNLWRDCSAFAAKYQETHRAVNDSISQIFGSAGHVAMGELIKGLYPGSAKETWQKLQTAVQETIRAETTDASMGRVLPTIQDRVLARNLKALENKVSKGDALWLIPLIHRVYGERFSPTVRGRSGGQARVEAGKKGRKK